MKRFSAGLPPRTMRSFLKSPAEATPGMTCRARLTSSKIPGSCGPPPRTGSAGSKPTVSGRSASSAVTVISLRRVSRAALTTISSGRAGGADLDDERQEAVLFEETLIGRRRNVGQGISALGVRHGGESRFDERDADSGETDWAVPVGHSAAEDEIRRGRIEEQVADDVIEASSANGQEETDGSGRLTDFNSSWNLPHRADSRTRGGLPEGVASWHERWTAPKRIPRNPE